MFAHVFEARTSEKNIQLPPACLSILKYINDNQQTIPKTCQVWTHCARQKRRNTTKYGKSQRDSPRARGNAQQRLEIKFRNSTTAA